MYQREKEKRMNSRIKDNVNVDEYVPMGLRICPLKKPRSVRYRDRFGYETYKDLPLTCDKNRCAWWDDERQCCGVTR